MANRVAPHLFFLLLLCVCVLLVFVSLPHIFRE